MRRGKLWPPGVIGDARYRQRVALCDWLDDYINIDQADLMLACHKRQHPNKTNCSVNAVKVNPLTSDFHVFLCLHGCKYCHGKAYLLCLRFYRNGHRAPVRS